MKSDLPDMESFINDFSLYQPVPLEISKDVAFWLFLMLGNPHRINSYCVQCGAVRTFWADKCAVKVWTEPDDTYRSFGTLTELEQKIFAFRGAYHLSLHCTFALEHTMLVQLLVQESTFCKIGQHPSTADLVKPDLTRYQALLGPERFAELRRAVGLHAHGVGIGSFVYLRRLLEDRMDCARQRAEAQPGWNPEMYGRARMDEKIKLLRHELPKHFVDNAAVYSVLSLGIHELSEDQCLMYHGAMLTAIELILDQELERRQRAEKEKENSAEIQKIHQNLS